MKEDYIIKKLDGYVTDLKIWDRYAKGDKEIILELGRIGGKICIGKIVRHGFQFVALKNFYESSDSLTELQERVKNPLYRDNNGPIQFINHLKEKTIAKSQVASIQFLEDVLENESFNKILKFE